MELSDGKGSSFKYVVYPGNNSAVIQQALNRRNIWNQIPAQKIMGANLVWKPLNFPANLYDQFDQLLRYDKERHVMLNHFENNNLITTKSGLVRSLKHYYSHQNSIYQQNYHVFETIPTTFIVSPNKDNGELKDFLERFAELQNNNYNKEKMPDKHCQKNVWYIKPQASNQGRGIALSSNLKQIQTIIFAKSINTSYILQKCIEKPLLYKNRKFDIRVWAVVTSNFEIYYYKKPYMRTTSYSYDLSDLSSQIHLTNNFQQKTSTQYSKFEAGNTIPLTCLKQYLISDLGNSPHQASQIMEQIVSRMKALVTDVFLSVRKLFLRGQKKKQFQLFGFDFLVDQDFRTWLIQVNNNPYLGTPNPFIKQIMPEMISQMFQIVLDPLFPPVDYQPVEEKNFQLLHKQISFFRINPLRSGSSDRKNYYPMSKQPNSAKVSSTKRRNSEALNSLYSFQSTQKHIKVRYSTPVESVRYLLDTYCFSDLQPFIVPVNFILTSPKLQEKDCIDKNVKNVKMITQTRICHILLESKFISVCKNILISETHPQQIKQCLLSGYFNAIRNHKNRVEVIKNIVPTFKFLLKFHERLPSTSITKIQENSTSQQTEKQQQSREIQQDTLVQSMIMLLIRLGGMINRKIFIPGQTREKQISRQFFINSGTLKILIYFKEHFPKLCTDQIQQFLSNLNSKDWDLYEKIKDQQSEVKLEHSFQQFSQRNINHDRSLTQSQLDHKFSLNSNYLDQKLPRSTFRDKFETTNIRNFARQNRAPLPKIKK